jgi:hypothetical protein
MLVQKNIPTLKLRIFRYIEEETASLLKMLQVLKSFVFFMMLNPTHDICFCPTFSYSNFHEMIPCQKASTNIKLKKYQDLE